MKRKPPSATDAAATAGLRTVFATVGRLAPSVAAWLAERLFFAPPPARPLPLPEGGEALAVEAGGRRLAAWRYGRGPCVLLMHGWGGSAGQMAPLVPALVARGFSAVVLDAPAHGHTPGRSASLPEFARALAAVGAAAGPVHAIVGHSLGAAAAAMAAAGGLPATRLVLIASAADPASWARAFAARFGVPAAAMLRMGARSERRLGFRWTGLHLGHLLRDFGGRVLFVHDRHDREARWSEVAELAQGLGQAQLVLTSGLGHRRILRHVGLPGLVAEFVAGGTTHAGSALPLATPCAAAGCGRPAEEGSGHCHRCALDAHLFQRETSRFPVPAAAH